MTLLSIEYVIMYIIGFTLLYTLFLTFGIRKAKKESNSSLNYILSIYEILNEIKEAINYKEDFKMKEVNTLSLTDLITVEPTEEQYEEVLDLLEELASHTYSEYKFFIAKSPDETKDPNFLQIVSNWSEHPDLHAKIFAKSINYGIDMDELRTKFAARVQEGLVIDLGENAVVITDDGTGNPPTGVSPINSGLEGGEIAFIISFIKAENYEEWKKNLEKEEEDEHVIAELPVFEIGKDTSL